MASSQAPPANLDIPPYWQQGLPDLIGRYVERFTGNPPLEPKELLGVGYSATKTRTVHGGLLYRLRAMEGALWHFEKGLPGHGKPDAINDSQKIAILDEVFRRGEEQLEAIAQEANMAARPTGAYDKSGSPFSPVLGRCAGILATGIRAGTPGEQLAATVISTARSGIHNAIHDHIKWDRNSSQFFPTAQNILADRIASDAMSDTAIAREFMHIVPNRPPSADIAAQLYAITYLDKGGQQAPLDFQSPAAEQAWASALNVLAGWDPTIILPEPRRWSHHAKAMRASLQPTGYSGKSILSAAITSLSQRAAARSSSRPTMAEVFGLGQREQEICGQIRAAKRALDANITTEKNAAKVRIVVAASSDMSASLKTLSSPSPPVVSPPSGPPQPRRPGSQGTPRKA